MATHRKNPQGPDDDPEVAALAAAPFRVHAPARQTAPFVFASPHSGRRYPASFLAHSRLTATGLRRSEDAFVDELFESAAAVGAPLLAAEFPRAYLDANRAPGELDPAMFDGPLALPLEPTGPRVAAGLGVIPRIVRDGAEIYRGRLPAGEAARRLSSLHQPYHAALGALLALTRRRFGVAVVVDCHSMPSAAAVPDIVIGDRYGVAASHVLMRHAERAFQSHGFSVARNVPYAGGYTTHLHGRPARGIHAMQIEINRALYLDEERIAKTARFLEIKDRIAAVLRLLTAIEPVQLGGPPDPLAMAAE